MQERTEEYFSQDTWRPEELGLVVPALRFKDTRELERMIKEKNQPEKQKGLSLQEQRIIAVIVILAVTAIVALSNTIDPNYERRLHLIKPVAVPEPTVVMHETSPTATSIVIFPNNATIQENRQG